MVYDIVPGPPAETKMPFPVFEPESAIPDTPTTLLAINPLSKVPTLCLPSAIAEPLASRIVFPVIEKVSCPWP